MKFKKISFVFSLMVFVNILSMDDGSESLRPQKLRRTGGINADTYLNKFVALKELFRKAKAASDFDDGFKALEDIKNMVTEDLLFSSYSIATEISNFLDSDEVSEFENAYREYLVRLDEELRRTLYNNQFQISDLVKIIQDYIH